MHAVPHSEALAILKVMVENPDKVRAVRAWESGSYGPFPYFVDWAAGEAEVTLAFSGGVVTELASVRIGNRFANSEDWDDNPLDDLRESEIDLLELAVRKR